MSPAFDTDVAAPPAAPPLLEVRGLVVRVPLPRESLFAPRKMLEAVRSVSFTLDRGRTLGIVGESGSGKTTAATASIRLAPSASGEVLFEGEDLLKLDEDGMRRRRRDVQIIFQDPYSSLNPRDRVGFITREPLDLLEVGDMAAREARVDRPELIGTGTGAGAFGFGRNRAYQIRIPGTAQGDAGPFLTGTDGTPNTNRLLCTVFTSLGVGPGFTRECVATVNSTGLPARIDATGTTSRLANDLTLEVAGLPQQSFGYFLSSRTPGQIVQPGGSTGTLCLAGNIGRFAGNVLNSGDTGAVALDVDLTAIPGNPPSAATAGDTWHFTYWHRDAGATGVTSNFSDAVRVEYERIRRARRAPPRRPRPSSARRTRPTCAPGAMALQPRGPF